MRKLGFNVSSGGDSADGDNYSGEWGSNPKPNLEKILEPWIVAYTKSISSNFRGHFNVTKI
jgi:hypothetical protein